MTDHALLTQYLHTRSQDAFAQLVRRHIDWLHSAALRLVRDPALAQDVTQAVFLVLMQKAPTLTPATPLAPWLFRVLQYVAANARRAETRRHNHESEAAAMRASTLTSQETADWSDLAPFLEAAVAQLPASERAAVLLRYYQQLSIPDVGTTLGITEEAARKRVTRAVDRLRILLTRKRNAQAAIPAAALTALLLAQTTHAAPAALTATAVGLSTGIASPSILALAKGALTMLLRTQLQFLALCASGLCVVGLLGVAFAQYNVPQPPTPAPAPPIVAAASLPAAPPDPAAVMNPELARRTALQQSAPTAPGDPAPAVINARAQFLAIERFARLPAAQQARDLKAFYHNTALVTDNVFLTGMMSSHPQSILKRRPLGNPGRDFEAGWSRELQDAVATQSPEQVADALVDTPADATYLRIASGLRTRYVLEQYRKDLIPLVLADLDAADLPSFSRGASAIVTLHLTECTPKLLDVYGKTEAESRAAGQDTPIFKQARHAFIFFKDPAVVPLLVPIIEKDPTLLPRYADIFDGALQGRPADPLLLKLLDSPDPGIREAATHAVADCKDPLLAKPIAKLAHDLDPRLHPRLALILGQRLSDKDFAIPRPDLLPFLTSENILLRVAAIRCFAAHKDPAAAPPLLAFLKQQQTPDSTLISDLTTALSTLTEGTIKYNQFQWGPADNARPLAQLEAWIQQHPQ